MTTNTDAVPSQLKRAIDLLDMSLGDSDPMIDDGATQDEIETDHPVMCAMQILTDLFVALQAPTAAVQAAVRVQYWLAELDQHGNPKLVDGAHSERSGADKAAYLMGALKLAKGRTFAVARVELSEAKPSAVGVNMEAVAQCRHMMGTPDSSAGDQA